MLTWVWAWTRPRPEAISANSTVFRYKGRETDPLAVGRELGVRAVLTGRLIQRGDNLTISTELLDVRDNKQVWGEQYNRKFSDLLAVQSDISKEISEKLRSRLTAPEQSRVTKRYTENPEAYELYLKGRYFWNKRSAESIKKSIEFFNQAIEKDPHYALAYASLADSYVIAASYSVLPPKEAMPKAKAAAMRALEIDDTLGQAHATLATVLDGYEWNWSASEDEFRRALELDPNYATAHQWYGEHLAGMGRLDEALKEVRRAQELDPLSLICNKELATTLLFAHRYDEAITQLHKTLEIDSNFVPAYIDLGAAYTQKGMYQEAIAALNKGLSVERDNTFALSWLAYAYAASGKRGEALKIVDQMKELSRQRYVAPTHLAIAYAGLGEREQVFQLLEKAYEQHDDGLIILKIAPPFDSLRSDPRFADLVRRVGLPQ